MVLSNWKIPLASYRTVSRTRLRSPPLSSLSYFQKNELDVFISRPICVSLAFLWGAYWAPRLLEDMALHVHYIWLEMIYVMPGMHEVARDL